MAFNSPENNIYPFKRAFLRLMAFINYRDITDQYKSRGYEKGEEISSDGLVVFPVAFGEPGNVGIEAVFAKGLKHFRSGHQARKSGGQRGRETPGVNQRTETRDQFHHLKARYEKEKINSPFQGGIA